MKKIFTVLTLMLALNFLAVAGGVGWLFQSGKIDKEKALAIRELVFPTSQPAAPATQPTTASSEPPPFFKLDELLAKHAGKRAGEQADVIQATIDAQTAQLDRRQRELEGLQAQVAAEQEQLARKNEKVDTEQRQLTDQQKAIADTATDKGFDDSLKLYSSMPGKQVKQVFMTLPDDIVVRYLETMPARNASKIIREFKTPDETLRINRLMEHMRLGKQNAATTKPAMGPGSPQASVPTDNVEAAGSREPK